MIVQRTQQATRDDDGKGHDSGLMACFDKAIVGFPEPPVTFGYLRDDVIKRMTGDQQSGRPAYSGTVETFRRTYTPFVPCNAIARPQNPADIAMRRRTHVLTCHRVFITDAEHKKTVESRMSAEQQQHAKLVDADPTKIPVVDADPTAASHMLNLLIGAWRLLIVDQKRKLVPSPLAAQVTKAYWDNLSVDHDSVVAFIKSQLILEEKAFVPKLNVWLAYNSWYRHVSEIDGSPGALIKSEQSFKNKVAAYFEHSSIDFDKQAKARVFKLSNPDHQNSSVEFGPCQSSVRCYGGLRLTGHPSYPDAAAQNASNEAAKGK